MLDVLKSRYITGLSASWCRKASPIAAPSAIFILMGHATGCDPVVMNDFKYHLEFEDKIIIETYTNKQWRKIKSILRKRWFSKLPRGKNSYASNL